jgi:hypothetical protein
MSNKIKNSIDQLLALKLEVVDSNEWVWGNPETDKKWIYVLDEAIRLLKNCQSKKGGERKC